MKNVLFLGSKLIGFECLKYLCNNKKEYDIEILGVLTNDNTLFGSTQSVKSLAKSNGVPIIDTLDQMLSVPNVDFIISVQYHEILKSKHIKVASQLALNLHMAPLPEYRGCNQFSFAIYNAEKEFGTTLHQLESGVDNGAILVERRFEIKNDWNVKELYDKTYRESLLLFKQSIGDIINGNYQKVKQSDVFIDRELFFYKRKDIYELKQFDLNDSAEEIIKRVRATAMPGFEQPFTVYNGEKYYLIPERNIEK